jgi:hypothetical protein
VTARALSKSLSLQSASGLSSPTLRERPDSGLAIPAASVQARGIRDRLPSGSTTSNNGTPRRVRPLMTARAYPSKGCRLRVTTTEAGRSWEWVVCRVFVRIG